MKKTIRQILASLLTIVMILSVVPMMGIGITASAAETYSGTCGENLTWTLDTATGELVISGEGKMDHFQYWYDGGSARAPWNAYNNYKANTIIKSIVVEDGVTSIGSFAFFRCMNLEKVFISDSVVEIEWSAFQYAEKLTDITIGKNVTVFSPDAFWDTGYYNDNTNWENGVLYLDNYVLWYDSEKALSEKIVIRDGTTAFAKAPFSGSGGNITEIILPDSVEFLSESAFEGCGALESIDLSDKLTRISERAFYGCASLSEITIPDSVTEIGEYAFNCCEKLESIKIGDGITNIGSKAFEYTALYDDESNWEEGVLYIGKYLVATKEYIVWHEDGSDGYVADICTPSGVIKDGTKVIADFAYEMPDSFLKLVKIPSSVTNIGNSAFMNCNKLTDVYYAGTSNEWNKIAIEEGNESLLNATIHFLGESEHTHSYSVSVTKEATCKETGVMTYTCSCEDTYTEVIPKKAHNTVHDITPSTCKVAGMEYDFCSGCGETFNVKTLPLNDHTWGEWKITTPPTASNDGISTRECSVCGKKETKSIQKLGVMKDENTGIEIEFDDEYVSGVEIKVEEVFDGDSFKLIENVCGNNNSEIYDISTIKNGEKVQPDGKVTVRIPVPAEFETTNILVFYIDSTNGTATNIPAKVVNGYVEFETDHFSYYAIVEKLGKVKSVSVNDISMDYKSSAAVTPSISVDSGVEYTVVYSSSNADVVSIDSNGRLTTNGTGSATITVTVTDEYGNTVSDTCEVNVKYNWWQWIIVIVLFGWIWY